MKTVSCFRLLAALCVAWVAVSCTDPVENSGTGTSVSNSSEYHAVISTWNQSPNGDFVTVLANLTIPGPELSRASVFALKNGSRVLISGHAPIQFGNGNLSATIQGTVVMFTFSSQAGTPPSGSLDVFIVY